MACTYTSCQPGGRNIRIGGTTEPAALMHAAFPIKMRQQTRPLENCWGVCTCSTHDALQASRLTKQLQPDCKRSHSCTASMPRSSCGSSMCYHHHRNRTCHLIINTAPPAQQHGGHHITPLPSPEAGTYVSGPLQGQHPPCALQLQPSMGQHSQRHHSVGATSHAMQHPCSPPRRPHDPVAT